MSSGVQTKETTAKSGTSSAVHRLNAQHPVHKRAGAAGAVIGTIPRYNAIIAAAYPARPFSSFA